MFKKRISQDDAWTSDMAAIPQQVTVPPPAEAVAGDRGAQKVVASKTGAKRKGNVAREDPWEPTEELSLGQRWMRGWRLLLILAVLLGGYGKWRGARDYQIIKGWRARGLVGQALEASAQGQMEKASALLDKAAILAPLDAVVMRGMADFCEGRRDIMAIYALRQLVKIGAAGAAERERICRLAMDWGHPELALTAELKAWSESEVEKLSALQLRLSAVWMGSRGQAQEGEERLRLALDMSANGPEAASLEVALSRMIMNGAGDAGMAESVAAEPLRRLSGVAYSPTAPLELRGEATRLLAGLMLHPKRANLLTPVRAELLRSGFLELAAAVEKTDPAAAGGYELAAVSVELKAFPQRQEALVGSLVEQAKAAPVDQRLAIARWFNENGQYQETLDICLANPELEGQASWFTVRMDALFARREFDRAVEELEKPDQPLAEHLRQLFLYRIQRQAPPDEVALAQRLADLDKAIARAAPKEVLGAADNLERAGALDIALTFFTRIKNDPVSGLSARLGMVRCLDSQAQSSEELIKALEGVLQLWPQCDQARSDLAYLRLLDRDPSAEDVPMVLQLEKQSPWFLSFRVTAALAHLSEARPGDALALLERDEVPWERVRPGWQAVYAAVLQANHRTIEAEEIAQRLAKVALRPGEQRLISDIMK